MTSFDEWNDPVSHPESRNPTARQIWDAAWAAATATWVRECKDMMCRINAKPDNTFTSQPPEAFMFAVLGRLMTRVLGEDVAKVHTAAVYEMPVPEDMPKTPFQVKQGDNSVNTG